MNRNEDLIELYHYGPEGNIETHTRNYQNPRSRSASLRPRSRSITLQRENSGSFVPLNEDDSNASGSIRFEQHTAEIIRSMEEDESLMEDNPISEHLRMYV